LTSSSVFDNFSKVRPYQIWPGAVAHAVAGRQLSVALVDLAPNTEVAEHSHPNEQVGFIIQGGFSFTIGSEKRDLGPGDTYVIPGGVKHSGRAGPDGAVVMDAFSPPRADWEQLERGEPRKAAWPRP
jgi:quercetin dioxygenase-like cupin family protein